MLGETVAGESDMRGSSSKASDDATASLGDMANPSSKSDVFSVHL